MNLRVLTAADLQEALDMPTAIDAMRAAFGQLSSGAATIPVRTGLEAGPVFARVLRAVYDALGREVVELERGSREAGVYLASWDGRDGRGRAAASGVYFVHLETDRGRVVTKITLAR